VLVRDMARKFDTSQVTIRKDLEVLHVILKNNVL
jgi:DeoR/GlpR family transcriptional regulator of sugar metabolism